MPQGAILGTLFLLYINDLPSCLCYSQPRMYADDTSITYTTYDINERLNYSLQLTTHAKHKNGGPEALRTAHVIGLENNR